MLHIIAIPAPSVSTLTNHGNNPLGCSALTCYKLPARYSEFNTIPNRVKSLTLSIVPNNNNTI